MKFYFTFRKSLTEPNEKSYAVVEAPCHQTAVDRLHATGAKNWSSVYTSRAALRGLNLKLWREL